MFAKAYKVASSFTFPVVTSVRYVDGRVKSGCGAFVILNNEGWFVTVAHIIDSYITYQKHKIEIDDYNDQKGKIEEDQSLNAKKKRRMIAKLKSNPNWIINHSFWWAADNVMVKDVKILKECDLAIGRLEPFDPASVNSYPVIKNPAASMDIGTSLCKLGFPFYEINASYNESNNCFVFPDGTLPIPRFPIEGIFTRNIKAGKANKGKYDIKLVETSSPGLRGQSGGPIFDIHGTVWAIQSKTIHFPLGFNPKVKINDEEIEEHQFLNAGLGVHAETVMNFLDDVNVRYEMSSLNEAQDDDA